MKQGALPNEDMPTEIARDFEEARLILNLSPRGAAALLRLCVEKLCTHLGAAGKTIDNKIADLVSKGLDERVKDALDVVRVIGNNAVHDKPWEHVAASAEETAEQSDPLGWAGSGFWMARRRACGEWRGLVSLSAQVVDAEVRLA